MTDEKPAGQVEDQELNDLLDSALKDFNKEQTTDTKANNESRTIDATTEKKTDDSLDEAWSRDFIRQAADQFQENLQHFMQDGTKKELDSELEASIKKMAEAVADVISETEGANEDSTSTDFQSAIANALNDLSATSENLQNEIDLSEMFGQASLEDGAGGILPFMQGMLHHLLSKEMLYPPLKELVDKYPEWLEEKKNTLSTADLEKYTRQLELMQKVCEELEKEKEDDSEDVKKKRFEAIMSLMEEAQNRGRLPEDLVGDQPNPFQFDGEGDRLLPALLGGMDSPQNCSLM